MDSVAVSGVDVRAPVEGRAAEILTPEALRFLGELERRFRERRSHLLGDRRERHARIASGEPPNFLPETREIRESDWQVAPAPADLQDRRVEITGPVERKMMINALNSGARCFMADFEDATSPTWANLVEGHANLVDAVEGTIELETEEGKRYELADEVATLIVRPRGWHLPERHVLVDGEPMSGSLFDFGLFVFHNGERLLESGSGPYLYLPKLEAHGEARLWNDVLEFAEETLGLQPASIRATVLVETILAAFEMHEILYELRERIVGLNAGRWDYIFSVIKRFAHRPEFVLPDRSQVTMTVPFMRAYTELLVQTCHRRGAHAMGGMAAFVPSRRDHEVNETALAKVREDKLREAGDGFDGTWVAHPDLVPVAAEVFDGVLGERPHQVDRQRDDVNVAAGDLLDVAVPGGAVTPEGLDNDVSVAIRYLESWLRGVGAVALYNLMEDAATAEIARSQVWQWLRHGRVTREEVEAAEQRELAETSGGRFGDAAELFEDVSLGDELVEFLTLPGYDRLD